MTRFSKPLLQAALANQTIDTTPTQLAMAPSDLTLKPPPANARLSAVMVLLYPQESELQLIFARRPDTLRDHPGQIAFPGGRREPGEAYIDTALRETEEELGVPAAQIEVLGQLRSVYVPPSNFVVHPFVGWHERRPAFVPSPDEVAELLEIPLSHFLNPNSRSREEWTFKKMNVTLDIPFYHFGQHKIWGATATILSELMARVENQIGGI